MDDFSVIGDEGISRVQSCETLDSLQQVQVDYLGKSGQITAALKALSSLEAEQKKTTRSVNKPSKSAST